MTHDHGKSDSRKVPTKFANKGGANPPAERDGGKSADRGKHDRQNTRRAQHRESVQSALDRVRKVARSDKKVQFTSLMHHISCNDRLRAAYFAMKRTAAAGVDGETWVSYGERLEENLQSLSERLQKGGYRAKPVRRVFNCLDALYVGLFTKKVNWVLDADIRGFFDNLNHEWLIKFVEHRIKDKRQDRSRGEMIIVRWADDFVVGFERRSQAEKFLAELKERMLKFSLELHPEKTRILEFGRYATNNRKKRGLRKPETFNFLGFTHICGTIRGSSKMFTVRRHTIAKKMRAKISEVKLELRKRMHHPIPDQGKWLKSVVDGHSRYYGVPTNLQQLVAFRYQVSRLWFRTLRRRSQNSTLNWKRMKHYTDRWLPHAKLHHPFPLHRLRV